MLIIIHCHISESPCCRSDFWIYDYVESHVDSITEGAFTVPAFNSYTKCLGIAVIKHERMPDYHPVSWAWMQPHVPDLVTDRGFDSQATWFIDVLGLFIFWPVSDGCLYNQALADVRSTGANIRCLYCSVDIAIAIAVDCRNQLGHRM